MDKRHKWIGMLLMSMALWPVTGRAQGQAPVPEWEGFREYRILVRVDPADIGTRTGDERPAQLTVNLQAVLQSQFGVDGIADMNSLQIMRYDPATGQAINDNSWAFGKSPADRAFRWYDAAIPYDYFEVETNLSSTGGALVGTNHPRWGYFYDTEGDWKTGKLAWSHVQNDNVASYYAIYFDALPAGTTPWKASPRGFLGDGGLRTTQVGSSTTGTIHTRIDVDDWDGDGLADIIAGNARGGMAWYKNIGTATQPEYGTSRLLFTTDGKPMDVGWSSTPKVVDWDGDGVKDIISSGERNRIVWYKNTGTNTDRRFEYKGLVRTSDGQPLILPVTPNPDIPTITVDYYSILDVVDYNNNGRKDLFAGGYITGQVFRYENIGTNPDGTPRLQFQGAVQADGVPLDTTWSAAPTFADFNGDGLLDIMAGTFKITAGGGDGASSENFLQYYVNVGTPSAPRYEQRTVPRTGAFPVAALGTPRAVDFNGDGLLDLAVSANTQIYLYENVGTATQPMWAAHSTAMKSDWGASSLGATQLIDWDGDGLLDRVNRYSVRLNTGQGNPGIYGAAFSVLPSGQTISHLSGIGDDWSWQRLFDLDGDGLVDAMDADHDGKIWFHRNEGTAGAPTFDTTGYFLKRVDGNPIDVGPGPDAPSFDILQGGRATYAIADFNQDGQPDIVVGNYDGIVRHYGNESDAPAGAEMVFGLPAVIGDLGTRLVPFATDWDSDGWVDIVASATPDRFMFIRNLGVDATGNTVFAPGVWNDLDGAPYGAGGPIIVADFNGDGDDDIILQTAYGFTTLTDGSFLRNGYANPFVIGYDSIASRASGDLDLDGFVGITDLNIILSNWNKNVPKGDWRQGDVAGIGDGFVGVSDLNVVLANWNAGTPPPNLASIIPEPSVVWVVGLGAAVFPNVRIRHFDTSSPGQFILGSARH
jgi:FG-GAP-like repeat